MAEQQLSSSEMYGIAKKVNQDLEKLPMHTHSAIVEMIRVGMQHRNLGMQAEQQQQTQEMQCKQMDMQDRHMKLQEMAAQREAVHKIGLVPPKPAADAAEPPAPLPVEYMGERSAEAVEEAAAQEA